MNYTIAGDRQAALRGLRRHYGPTTRDAAWQRAMRIAKRRKVPPLKVNWDFCLFMAFHFERRGTL